MPSKLIFAPITLLLGGWMFTSSFGTNTIQQSATPYSTQQQIVEVEMPFPSKVFFKIRWCNYCVCRNIEFSVLGVSE